MLLGSGRNWKLAGVLPRLVNFLVANTTSPTKQSGNSTRGQCTWMSAMNCSACAPNVWPDCVCACACVRACVRVGEACALCGGFVRERFVVVVVVVVVLVKKYIIMNAAHAAFSFLVVVVWVGGTKGLCEEGHPNTRVSE